MILSEINQTQINNSPLFRNGNRNETIHFQGELKVTGPCGLHIPNIISVVSATWINAMR